MDKFPKISGIYDQRTMKFLKEKGISFFSFDFDPKSFNFLPCETFREIIFENYSPLDSYHLHFSKSSQLNIENTIQNFLMASGQAKDFLSNLYLEIDDSDMKNAPDLNLPILAKIDFQSPLEQILKNPNLRGFIIDFSQLEIEKDQAKAFHFLNIIFMLKAKHNLRIDLKIPWESNISSSIFDFFPFDYIELSINRKVEVCYRNVNLSLLEKEIGFISNYF
jgi:hypothetical protein